MPVNDQPNAGEVRPVGELRLQPLAESVRAARQFLRQVLREAHREEWGDAAELALSEVVTNGVLHAHTELVIRVRITPELLEVEVQDANPALPAQRRAPDAEATTGRGLELVAALTRECGVRPEPAGKVVWFTIADDDPGAGPSEDDLLAAWDLDSPWDVEAPQAADAGELRDIVLKDMPTTLWLAAREHHQAMLRELVLYLAEHADSLGTAPDLVLADQARNLIWTTILQEIDRARAAGTTRRPLPEGHPSPLPDVPESVDLQLSVPPDVGAAFGAMQDALDLGEQLAVADQLLVRPALPEIVAVRDWACEQVVAQLAGVPASPWLGADQARFVDEIHDRVVPDASAWDATEVTASPRGVVAADDANRIIAISDSLARAVGWTREDLVGRRVVALIPPALREAHVAGFSRHLTTGEAHVLGVELELPVLHKDGTEIACTFLIERTYAGSGRPIYLAWIEPIEG